MPALSSSVSVSPPPRGPPPPIPTGFANHKEMGSDCGVQGTAEPMPTTARAGSCGGLLSSPVSQAFSFSGSDRQGQKLINGLQGHSNFGSWSMSRDSTSYISIHWINTLMEKTSQSVCEVFFHIKLKMTVLIFLTLHKHAL